MMRKFIFLVFFILSLYANYITTGSYVNCRRNPCTNSKVLTKLHLHQVVTSMGMPFRKKCGHTWIQIKSNNKICWSSSKYLRRKLNNKKPTKPSNNNKKPAKPNKKPTKPNNKPSNNSNQQCFPVARNSLKTITGNFGQTRSGGGRCHAGNDLLTKSPGLVQSIADGGIVQSIFNFMHCKSGWAGPGQTKAVMVYYPSLGKTINYGEIDAGHVKVRVGQRVSRKTIIGRSGHCGMLHFEVYSGKRSSNLKWMPPRGRRAVNCAQNFMGTKPKGLEDPRILVNKLKGKYC